MVFAKSIINVEDLTKMIKFWGKKKRKRENAKKWMSIVINYKHWKLHVGKRKPRFVRCFEGGIAYLDRDRPNFTSLYRYHN